MLHSNISYIICTCRLPITVEIIMKKWVKPSSRVPVARAPNCGAPWVLLTWGNASGHKPSQLPTRSFGRLQSFSWMYLHAGVSLVHVDEHRSMCPDPELRRGAMRALAELPGVQVLETSTNVPPLPARGSSETCRRPIACLIPDVGTIMKERLRSTSTWRMRWQHYMLR